MPAKKTYRLTATLLATFEIDATSLASAKQILQNVLDCQDANFGSLPDGTPLVTTVGVEGEIDAEDED
jgi:hypothetical protein